MFNPLSVQTFFSLLLVGLFGSTMVEAQQIMHVQEGIQVSARLSSKGLNRIAIQNDRILSVKGTQGEFELDKDSELGQIFVTPKSKDGHEPIHLFLITESGKTYALALHTEAIDAQSIVLVPMGSHPAPFEQGGAYEALIKTLIKAMHTQSNLEGFVVEPLNIQLPSLQGARVVVLQSYTGHPFTAEVLELHNTTPHALNLHEMDFYMEGVRAITLLHKELPPKAKTRVYRVRS